MHQNDERLMNVRMLIVVIGIDTQATNCKIITCKSGSSSTTTPPLGIPLNRCPLEMMSQA